MPDVFYDVMTPITASSGGRNGYNQFVTDVDEAREHIGGEKIDGQVRTQMRHGDLLLNVRPSGFAKDRHSFTATLFVAIEDNLQLLMTLNWPERRRQIIRRIIAYRQSGAVLPINNTPGQQTIEARLCAAINEAMDVGLTNQQIIKLAMQCDAARRTHKVANSVDAERAFA